MNTSKALVAIAVFAFAFKFSATAFPGPGHAPKYGGVVQEAGDMQYELVVKADSIAIFVEDHDKKVDTKGGTAKVTLLNGANKIEATLVAAGGNKLEAKGSFKFAKGTKAVAVVQLAGKPISTARFVLP